ncbi:MAG: stalk domain-containing protein [Candidatus Xenobia bacterium]
MRYARCGLVLALVLSIAAVAQVRPVSVSIDGRHVHFATFTRDGMVWLPVFPTASALSVAIVYEPQTQQVTLDGQQVQGTPQVRSGEVYLPADAIAAAIGAGMQWDAQARTLVLTTPHYAHAHGMPKPVPPQVAAAPAPPRTSPLPEAPPPPAIPEPPAVLPEAASAPPTAPPIPTPNPNAPVQPYPGGPYAPSTAPLPTGAYPGTIPDSTIPFPGTPPITGPRPPAGGGSMPYAAPPPPLPGTSGLPPAATSSTPVGRPPTAPSVVEQYHEQHPDAGGLPEAYQPRTAANGVFSVTVTNVQSESTHRSHYSPRPGYKFVVVYLSQQNVSAEAQIYTGTFTLVDQRGASFDPAEGLSNFFLAVLRPYGVNFGYLTFEIPEESQPTRLVLTVPTGTGLSVEL